MEKTIYTPMYRALLGHLRRERRRLNMTQAQAAAQLGVSRAWVQKAESGQLRLDLVQVLALASIYGVTPTTLIKLIQETRHASRTQTNTLPDPH